MELGKVMIIGADGVRVHLEEWLHRVLVGAMREVGGGDKWEYPKKRRAGRRKVKEKSTK